MTLINISKINNFQLVEKFVVLWSIMAQQPFLFKMVRMHHYLQIPSMPFLHREVQQKDVHRFIFLRPRQTHLCFFSVVCHVDSESVFCTNMTLSKEIVALTHHQFNLYKWRKGNECTSILL